MAFTYTKKEKWQRWNKRPSIHQCMEYWDHPSCCCCSVTATAAAAKSLQSCPTLCDPIDGSPPGSPVPGILQARTLEWVAVSFSKAWKWKVKVKSLSRVQLSATPWTAAYQAPPSMGFSRQEYWSGVPLPSPCSVTKSCPNLCDPMDCSTPGFPVLHCLLEFAHTHVHWVGDAIQPSHPLLPSSPPTLNLSQHQGLFQWVGSSPQVAKGLDDISHNNNSTHEPSTLQTWSQSILTQSI